MDTGGDVAQKYRLESLLSIGFPVNSMLVLADADTLGAVRKTYLSCIEYKHLG